MNYEKKDWPSLPDEMVKELIPYTIASEPIGGNLASIDYEGASKVYGIIKAPEYLTSWIKDNLPLNEEFFIGLQRFVGIFKTPIHKDSIRSYCYNNVLTSDSPTTVFYNDDKQIIETVKYKQNQWYYHNTDVFHKVTEVQKFRAAVTIFKPLAERRGEKYILSDSSKVFLDALK